MERVYMGARRCVLVGEGVDFILFYFLFSLHPLTGPYKARAI